MKLEAGKKYTDRRGRVYGPLIQNSTCFGEGPKNYAWSADGRISSSTEYDMDLVAEYVEPVQPEYRMLQDGEAIQDGDEYQDFRGEWKPVPSGFGQTYRSQYYWPHRRLVEPVKVAEPAPVESPDDLVIQDRVPARAGIDFGWNVELKDFATYAPCERWKWAIGEPYTGRMHGSSGNIGRLAVLCRRKDLPPVPPKTRTVVLKEWIVGEECGYVGCIWASEDPSKESDDLVSWGWASETGNTRTVEIPVT